VIRQSSMRFPWRAAAHGSGAAISFLTRSHAEIITERFDSPLLRAARASLPPFAGLPQMRPTATRL
jgi:hypothetical protein